MSQTFQKKKKKEKEIDLFYRPLPPCLLKKSRAWSSWRKRRERNRNKIKRKGEWDMGGREREI